MSLEEKILFLENELSKNPNSHPELKAEVEAQFDIDVSKWESYKDKLDNGYQLASFTLLTGRHFDDPDVGSGSFTRVIVTSYIALMPICLVEQLPYFHEYVHLGSEEEFLQYINDFRESFMRYLSLDRRLLDLNSPQNRYYKLMQNAEAVLKDLIACGKVVVLESSEYSSCFYYDGWSVPFCEVKSNTTMGRFVTSEDGKVTFEFACPDIKNNIMDLASGKNMYVGGEQMVIKQFNEKSTE